MKTLLAGLAAVLTLSAAPVAAQSAADSPNKPIRVIVPFGAGSGADETSRVYGEIVSKMLGQQVIVVEEPTGRQPARDPGSQSRRRPTATPCCRRAIRRWR